MVEKNPITPEGFARLRDELHQRRSVERPKIVDMVAVAREHGDLKENAEYHAAREKHAFNEGRIKELEDKLARAEVIDPSKLKGAKIAFGARIVLCNENGDEVRYRIVGADETDANNGEISITSPLARSLLGREAGDEVKARMPGGERVFEVVSVEFG
jgi:transcription elongation factor GreA